MPAPFALPRRGRRALALGAVAPLLLAVGGCGGSGGGGSTEVVTIDITVQDGEISPADERIEIDRNQPVDLVVTADVAGQIGVHTEPETYYEFDEGTSTFKFQIDRPGTVAVETHDPDHVIAVLLVQ